MLVSQSAVAVQGSFYDLWYTVLMYVPTIILAVVLFVIGWVLSTVLYRVVVEVCRALRIDTALRVAGVGDLLKDAGFNLNAGKFLGFLIQWFVLLVFLAASLDVLGLTRVTIFIQQVILLYIPQLIAAALIIILAALIAEAAKRVVTGSAHAAGAHHGANLAGSIVKWAIWITAILAALTQIGIATAFIQTLFTGMVVAASLAFGLAFGLGGKDAAAATIERIRREIAHSQE
jgi:hypothetical protein